MSSLRIGLSMVHHSVFKLDQKFTRLILVSVLFETCLSRPLP